MLELMEQLSEPVQEVGRPGAPFLAVPLTEQVMHQGPRLRVEEAGLLAPVVASRRARGREELRNRMKNATEFENTTRQSAGDTR